MPSTFQDVIQTALQVQDIQLNQRAQKEREIQNLAQRVALMQAVGSNLERGAQEGLSQQFERENLVGNIDLGQMFEASPVSPQAASARAAEAGMQGLPEEDMATAEREAALQALTGGGSADLAVTQALSGIPEEEITQAARIGLGTGLDAGQNLQAEIQTRGQELQWLDMTQRSALAEADLQLRDHIAHLDYSLGLSRIKAVADGDLNAAAELSTFASLARNLESNKTGMSNTDIIAHLTAMQTIFQRLEKGGYPVPGDLFDEDIESLREGRASEYLGIGGTLKRGLKRWWGSRQREGGR